MGVLARPPPVLCLFSFVHHPAVVYWERLKGRPSGEEGNFHHGLTDGDTR